MENQIPNYLDTNAVFQDYNAHHQPPPPLVPESSSVPPFQPQAQSYTNSYPSQSVAQAYESQRQRTSSEPTLYPNHVAQNHPYIPQANYFNPPQRQRTRSAGAASSYPGVARSMEGLPPAFSSNSHAIPPDLFDFSWMNSEHVDSAGPSCLTEPGRAAEISAQDHALSAQQPPPPHVLPRNILPGQHDKSFSTGVRGYGVLPGPALRPPPYAPNQYPRGTPRVNRISDSEGAPTQYQVQRLDDTTYMRQPAPHPGTKGHISRGGVRNGQKELQREDTPTRVAKNVDLMPISSAPQQPYLTSTPHLYPQLQPDGRIIATHEGSLPRHSECTSTAFGSCRPGSPLIERTYVDVGVQTDPWQIQPARGHASRKVGSREEDIGGAEARKSSDPNPLKRKRSSQSASSARATPKLVPLAPRPPTGTSLRRPTVITSVPRHLNSQHIVHSASQDRLAPNQSGVHAQPTSQARSAPTPVLPTAATRSVQWVQGLISPYTPDSGMHQAFSERDKVSHGSALISQSLPHVSWQDSRPRAMPHGSHPSTTHGVPEKHPLTPASSFSGSQFRTQSSDHDANIQSSNHNISESRVDYQQFDQSTQRSAQYQSELPGQSTSWQPSMQATRDVTAVSHLPFIVVSQPDTFESDKSQLGVTQQNQARQVETSRSKRKRSTSIFDPERQARRQRRGGSTQVTKGTGERQVFKVVGFSHLEPPALEVARSNTQPFDFNKWLSPKALQDVLGDGETVVVATENAQDTNLHQPMHDIYSKGTHTWNPSTTEGITDYTPHAATEAFPGASSSVRAALIPSPPTCSGASSPSTHKAQAAENVSHTAIPAASTVGGTLDLRSQGGTSNRGISPVCSTAGHARPDVAWATQNQRQTPLVQTDVVDSSSFAQQAYGSEIQDVVGGAQYTAVGCSEPSTQGREGLNLGSATATPAPNCVTGPTGSSLSGPYLQILAESQGQHLAAYGDDIAGMFSFGETNY